MATLNLGRVRFNWRGTYSPTTPYLEYDTMEFDGESHVCIAPVTGVSPTDSSGATYWEPMLVRSADYNDARAQAIQAAEDAQTARQDAQTALGQTQSVLTEAEGVRDDAVSQTGAIKDEATTQAVRAEYAATSVEANKIPMFSPMWWPKRSTIPAGYVPADGQLLNRSTYPDAAAGVLAGNVPVVTESDWMVDPLARGSYTAGDGSTTFRMPDYNGQSAGSVGPLFLRGGASEGGVIQRDEFKAHSHGPAAGSSLLVFGASDANLSVGQGGSLIGGASGDRTADTGGAETRPLNAGGVWVVKLFGAVVNEGEADAAQLATDVASLQGQAANAYRPSNIIGTVSQLDGVPTGAIIERGSSASGEYVKYADGTLICYRLLTYTAVLSNVAGQIFYAQTPDPAGHVFPHAFNARPACTYTSDAVGETNTSTFVMTFGTSTQYRWHVINPFTHTSIGQRTITVQMTAIGRWY